MERDAEPVAPELDGGNASRNRADLLRTSVVFAERVDCCLRGRLVDRLGVVIGKGLDLPAFMPGASRVAEQHRRRQGSRPSKRARRHSRDQGDRKSGHEHKDDAIRSPKLTADPARRQPLLSGTRSQPVAIALSVAGTPGLGGRSHGFPKMDEERNNRPTVLSMTGAVGVKSGSSDQSKV
jgi:hypothetical protein